MWSDFINDCSPSQTFFMLESDTCLDGRIAVWEKLEQWLLNELIGSFKDNI